MVIIRVINLRIIFLMILMGVSPLSGASGPFVQEWRSAHITTIDGDEVEVSPGNGVLNITIKIEGKKYPVESSLPPSLAIRPGGVFISFFPIKLGKNDYESQRIVSVDVITEAFDENDNAIIETYVYEILPSRGICTHKRLDSKGSVQEVVRYCNP